MDTMTARQWIGDIVQQLRVYQWLKNTLVFLPVLAAQELANLEVLLQAGVAFVAFSLIASSGYVINDLHDIESDRLHPEKRHRPFASGRLPTSTGPPLVIGLMATSLALSITLLPLAFTGVLIGYWVATNAYSLKLKDTVLIDVLTLAGLYTLRVIAGAVATGIEPSVWLLGFSLFFFLSIAMLKRYAELHAAYLAQSVSETLPGRSYNPLDLPVLIALGVASGCLSVLVLALYIISDEFASHYSHQYVLWLLCPLTVYWIGRAWIVVARNEMHSDPLVWALKDELSRWVAVLGVLILILAR